MKPTPQQDLILDNDGDSVVIAAPGSGKTFVIANKIKNNLKSLMDHQGIIAISYTNKASNELKHRSLSNGENPRASFFGTIDKFYLSELVIPFGKHLYGIPEQDINIVTLASLPEDKQAELSWINRYLTIETVDKVQLRTLKELFVAGTVVLESVGFLANYIFDYSLACRNYLKSRYKYLYIDEYQDSGYQQHQLFLKINSLGIIAIAVGDLNQSIYAFSGKDSIFLEELAGNRKFKYFKLDKNHRCDPSIINYSNYLLNKSTSLIDTKQNHILFCRAEGKEQETAEFIDKVLPNIIKEYKIEHNSQIAILTRSRRTAELIDSALETPHTYSESNDLDMHLNVWSGIFSGLLHFVFDPSHQFTQIIELISTYESYSRPELKEMAALKLQLESRRAAPMEDITELIEIFIKLARLISPKSESPESVKLLTEVLRPPYSIKGYLPAAHEEVKIMTIHKSKGLEFDLVIHLDLHEWVFPLKMPGENKDFQNPVYGDLKQDLNLHYVAVTRARKFCLLLSSTKRTNSAAVVKNAKDSEFVWQEGIEKLRYIVPKAD